MQTAESAEFATAPSARFFGHVSKIPFRYARLLGAAAASLFILLGPGLGQILGWHSPYLREWVMFSSSGVGVLKGTFTLHRPGGAVASMTPLDVLGLTHYPALRPDDFGRLVLEPGDLRTFASQICSHPSDVEHVSFHGFVGTRQGWRPLEVENVCALTAPEPELKPRKTEADQN